MRWLGTYLKRRDTASVLATSHASNLTGLTAESDPALLFTGNSSCVLGPEVTEGPYCKHFCLVRGFGGSTNM